MLKRIAAMIMSMILVSFIPAYAAEDYDDRDTARETMKPYYEFDTVYDKDMDTYFLNIYLTSSEVLVDGAIGLAFDDTVTLEWNGWDNDLGSAGYLAYNSDVFEPRFSDDFELAGDVFKSNNQVVFAYSAVSPRPLSAAFLGTVAYTYNETKTTADLPFEILDFGETVLGDDAYIMNNVWRYAEIDEYDDAEDDFQTGYYRARVLTNSGAYSWPDIEYTIKLKLQTNIKGRVLTGGSPSDRADVYLYDTEEFLQKKFDAKPLYHTTSDKNTGIFTFEDRTIREGFYTMVVDRYANLKIYVDYIEIKPTYVPMVYDFGILQTIWGDIYTKDDADIVDDMDLIYFSKLRLLEKDEYIEASEMFNVIPYDCPWVLPRSASKISLSSFEPKIKLNECYVEAQNYDTGVLYVAGYTDNTLVKTERINGYYSLLTGYDECDTVKAFLWGGESGMEPLGYTEYTVGLDDNEETISETDIPTHTNTGSYFGDELSVDDYVVYKLFADYNDDGKINTRDISTILTHYLMTQRRRNNLTDEDRVEPKPVI